MFTATTRTPPVERRSSLQEPGSTRRPYDRTPTVNAKSERSLGRRSLVVTVGLMAFIAQGQSCESCAPAEELDNIGIDFGEPYFVEVHLLDGAGGRAEAMTAMTFLDGHGDDCLGSVPTSLLVDYERCVRWSGTATSPLVFEAQPRRADTEGVWRCATNAIDLGVPMMPLAGVTIEGDRLRLDGSARDAGLWCGARFVAAEPEDAVRLTLTLDGQPVDQPGAAMFTQFEAPRIEAMLQDEAGEPIDPDAFEFEWQWRSGGDDGGGGGAWATFGGRRSSSFVLPLLNDIEVSVSVRERSAGGDLTDVATDRVAIEVFPDRVPTADETIILMTSAPTPRPTYAVGEVVRVGIEVYDVVANRARPLTSQQWMLTPTLTGRHMNLEGTRTTFIADYSNEAAVPVTQTRALGGLDSPPGLLEVPIPPDTPPGNYWLYFDVVSSDAPASTVADFAVTDTDHFGRLVWFIQVVP